MNPVEIEQAVTELMEQPFDEKEFPFAFLQAFGNKQTTIKRLRSGETNRSDVGGVLQRNHIHIATAPIGEVDAIIAALKKSPATHQAKARYVLATDGVELQAEDLVTGEPIVCSYEEFPNHFGAFLPLAGITTVEPIRENTFDIRATSQLNKLYVELLKDNPDWATAERRHEMNNFIARLIFCLFAEDTGIFGQPSLFTKTVRTMSTRNDGNTDEVIHEIFRAMTIEADRRDVAKVPRWASAFPYVNGGLFSGSLEVPKFSNTARSYLLRVSELDWTKVNPDIFGSMIQAIADEDERGQLGMHYTSVPNILKVLNPLFLDDLRAQLDRAGDNPRMLLNLRNRLANIRVFDPACGSGNFLVIAYKQMREIEYEINKRRGEGHHKSVISLRNFRGIELRHFSVEIARLALIIAEYQCDELYRGPTIAADEFLPLSDKNWITCGNALRMDWLKACPPVGETVKLHSDDLFQTPLEQPEIDFDTAGGEVYVCGNPPYLGSTWQSKEQKADLEHVFRGRTKKWRSLDYVTGWFMKAAEYGMRTGATSAFVATNSICQGQQVPILWPAIFQTGHEIAFAHTSFKWANLASHNAGVTVAIVAISRNPGRIRRLFSVDDEGNTIVKETDNINAYLVSGPNVIVQRATNPTRELAPMSFGNKPVDGGNLLLTRAEVEGLRLTTDLREQFIRRIYGSSEFIRGEPRYCLWIEDENLTEARKHPEIRRRIAAVRTVREQSRDKSANNMAARPHQFREMNIGTHHTLIVSGVSSERRQYLPVGLIDNQSTLTNLAYGLFDAPLWNMAIIASKLHLVWIATVCGKLKTDFRYSNTMGWNTFPVPRLTEKNKADLTECAENILLAREAHFPATIAELYDPDNMPDNLRAAHERNDEVLERIYIGRRFRNDTERLEKLFDLYTRMTTGGDTGGKRVAGA